MYYCPEDDLSLSSDATLVLFYTDSKEVPDWPLMFLQWGTLGLTAVASLSSEIFVRCLVPCTTNTNHSSNLTITNMINSFFNCTFPSLFIIRALINPYLMPYTNHSERQIINGCIVTLGLLFRLVTKQQARAHLAGRLRNLMSSMGLEPGEWGLGLEPAVWSLGLEPGLVLPGPGRGRVQPVTVALVEHGGNTAR
jgi:hypothetical protein